MGFTEIDAYREQLLRAVKQSAEVLLTANEGDALAAVMRGMEIVGRCLNVDRVQIWRNELIDDELSFVMRHEWLSELGGKRVEMPVGLAGRYCDRNGWLERFMRGDYINAPVSTLPDDESAFWGCYGMKSIVILPLFLDGEFIGFFNVDDCEVERTFTGDEMDMMASVGLMLASVFTRNRQAEVIADTRQQLDEALKQAVSASRAKSDFLSTMSHEMRTPMNAIIGMTAIAKKTDDPIRINDALNKVSDAASHLLGIINAVLDMSKIESENMELQSVSFDLHNMIDKIVDIHKFKIEEKSHRLGVSIGGDVPRLYEGDDQRLTQVITNLLSNAIIYTTAGGEIHLSVVLERESDGECGLRFEVRDNGIGISPEQQGRLFDMFEQADGSIVRRYGGTGLGLTISKRLVELMGGELSVESTLGEGSAFYFTVNLKKLDILPALAKQMNASQMDVLAGKRILLVEDLEINREIFMAQLEDTELTIDIAVNGKEALNIVSANPSLYDLIFMDIQMPKMDGLEATRQIRAIDAAKAVPILALTANVFTDDIERCLDAGMNDHIGKPADADVILDKLRKWVMA